MAAGQGGRRSVLKTVATAPFQLVRGGVSLVAGASDAVTSPRADAGAGMADQWCGVMAGLLSRADFRHMSRRVGKALQ